MIQHEDADSANNATTARQQPTNQAAGTRTDTPRHDDRPRGGSQVEARSTDRRGGELLVCQVQSVSISAFWHRVMRCFDSGRGCFFRT